MQPRKCSPAGWSCVCAATLLVVTTLVGCSRTSVSGKAGNTGLLTGYEMGNPDDYAETRKERPDYQPFE